MYNYLVFIQSYFYDLTDEIICWKLIKVAMPYEYSEFTKIAQNIRNVYKNVTMVLKDYNYIIAGIFIIVVDNIVRGKLM